jgi:hypothetical protein
MAKYRKKPVVIEASQWLKPGDHPAVKMPSETDKEKFKEYGLDDTMGVISTLEGDAHFVKPGSWIVTGICGEHYAVDPNIFAGTFELAEDSVPEDPFKYHVVEGWRS